MPPLDWGKAKRDSVRARARDERPSGQKASFKGSYKPTTDRQRTYIDSLCRAAGVSHVTPPLAWQASELIARLKKLPRV